MNINDLPPEILLDIFSYCDFESILSMKKVCPHWNDIIMGPTLWNTLHVEMHNDLNPKFTRKIFAHFPLIKLVDVCSNSNPRSVHKTVKNFIKEGKMVYLNLFQCSVSYKTIRLINTYPQLQSLILTGCIHYPIRLTNIEINFSLLPNLYRLYLSYFGLSNNNFYSLLQCNNLGRVDIEQIKINQSNIEKFLEKNKDQLIFFHYYGGAEHSGRVFEYLSKCTKIRDLSIEHTNNINDKSLDLLTLLRLHTLGLGCNGKITENGLNNLFSNEQFCSYLKNLNFSHLKNMTVNTLNIISRNCKHLEFITFNRCTFPSSSHENVIRRLFPKTVFSIVDKNEPRSYVME